MKIKWLQLTVFDLLTEGCEVILVPRRPSTKTVYLPTVWKRLWLGVLKSILIRFLHLCPRCFVLSLARQGFALHSVKGYLSAILAFLQLPDQPSLFKSLVLTHFLKVLQHTT